MVRGPRAATASAQREPVAARGDIFSGVYTGSLNNRASQPPSRTQAARVFKGRVHPSGLVASSGFLTKPEALEAGGAGGCADGKSAASGSAEQVGCARGGRNVPPVRLHFSA